MRDAGKIGPGTHTPTIRATPAALGLLRVDARVKSDMDRVQGLGQRSLEQRDRVSAREA
jgi:hypothetical protein